MSDDIDTDVMVDDEEASLLRDAAMWLRWACRRDTSFRTDSLRSISIRSLVSRVAQIEALRDPMARDLSHQTVILKSGIELGLIE